MGVAYTVAQAIKVTNGLVKDGKGIAFNSCSRNGLFCWRFVVGFAVDWTAVGDAGIVGFGNYDCCDVVVGSGGTVFGGTGFWQDC